MKKQSKVFSQEVLVQDLYNLYHMTVNGTVEPKVASAATSGAREIGKLLRLKLDQQQANKPRKQRSK